MFCDIRHFSDIFEVELATHFVDPVEELQGTAQRKIDEVLIERLLHELYPIIKSSPTGRQTSLLSLHYNEREDGLPPPEPSLFD